MSWRGSIWRRNLVAVQEWCTGRANSFLHSRVSQLDWPTERGKHATGLQQRSHPRPPALRVRPMQRRCRINQPVASAWPQGLERGLHGLDVCWHVLKQLGKHGLVRLGRGNRDPPLSEQPGCFACPSANLEGSTDRLTRVRHHHVEELRGIPRPESFVCFRYNSEAQCAVRHAEHPDTICAVNAWSFRATRPPDLGRQESEATTIAHRLDPVDFGALSDLMGAPEPMSIDSPERLRALSPGTAATLSDWVAIGRLVAAARRRQQAARDRQGARAWSATLAALSRTCRQGFRFGSSGARPRSSSRPAVETR